MWVACGILVPRPGIKPVPPAVEAQSLNHWTSREVPIFVYIAVYPPIEWTFVLIPLFCYYKQCGKMFLYMPVCAQFYKKLSRI